MGMTAEQADDHISEFGRDNPLGEGGAAEREMNRRQAEILVEMAQVCDQMAADTAERRSEVEAWTNKWPSSLKPPEWFQARREKALALTLETARHRERAAALRGGAAALGYDPDR